ncbi:EamA family transporter [Frigidibacter sp. MR17.14]|uniref:EamA family transporter n=1 Tax=Frigidibacter sp. MR17.14 TaxID=3126509 RepID=UPI003012E6EE
MLMLSWPLWAALSAAFAALTAIFARVGLRDVPSDYATFLRTLVILPFLALMVSLRGQWQPLSTIPGKAGLFLVLSGLATGASWLCYFRALSLGPAAQVASIDKMSVVLVAVFAALFLGEALSARAWAGVALIVIGVLIVSHR